MTEYELFKLLCYNQSVSLADSDTAKTYYDSLINKGLAVILNNNDLLLSSPIIPLDIDRISNFLPTQSSAIRNNIKIVYDTDSTNKLLSTETKQPILVAEYQSSGKGRSGRQWISPIGHNIYLSIKYDNFTNQNLSFFPLYVSLQLAQTLSSAGIDGISIKWPNDLYLHQLKFCGCILEACFSSKSIILGIGINVSMPESYTKIIDQPFTSISQFYENDLCDRNYLLAMLLPQLINLFDDFNPDVIPQYLINYDQFNFLKGKSLMVYDNNTHYIADYVSINSDGSLKVKTMDGYKDLYSADVSVRVGSDA